MLRLLPFDDGQGARIGLLRGKSQVLDLSAVAPKTPTTMDRILAGGPYLWDALREHKDTQAEPGQLLELDRVVALPLMGPPRRVAATDDQDSSILGVVAPEAEAETTAPDHIAGIAAIVRRRCKDVSPEEALDVLAGFTPMSGLLEPGREGRHIVAAQFGPLLLPDGISMGHSRLRVFLDDEPVEDIDGAIDWAAVVAAASKDLLRPGDVILLAGERRNVPAPAEVRVALAAAGHSVGRIVFTLTAKAKS